MIALLRLLNISAYIEQKKTPKKNFNLV